MNKSTASFALAAWAILSPSIVNTAHSMVDQQTICSVIAFSLKDCSTNAYLSQDEIKYAQTKKSYRERYKRIGESEWFNKHYNNKSLGEVIEIVD